ncbi:MAG TPA: chorismate mutase [Desulfovibrio sp.]|nr:chorismate mutase [Desulfovibrio sp.]
MDTEALTILRKEIDLLDGALLDLLQKRAYLSKQVAKAKQGGTIFYPLREKEIVAKLQELNLSAAGEEKKQVLPSESIRHIWTEIFSCSRSLQQKTSLAFLGPAGTFSHFAGLELMGKSLNFVPCHDFNAIFAKVHAGEVRYGLVPLENSLQGTVGQCLDLFEEYPVSIVAEHYSGICQCLLSKQQDMRRIEVIYSHPQALMQSHEFLRTHCPNARLVEMSSTAEAAKRAVTEENAATVGHEGLAELCGENVPFHVLAKDIAGSKENITRFALIAKEQNSGVFRKPKTSFTFTVVDKAGALSQVLQILHKADINLSKLESRPSYHAVPGSAWQYRFFADAQADLREKPELTLALKEFCYDIRILGVYENLL